MNGNLNEHDNWQVHFVIFYNTQTILKHNTCLNDANCISCIFFFLFSIPGMPTILNRTTNLNLTKRNRTTTKKNFRSTSMLTQKTRPIENRASSEAFLKHFIVSVKRLNYSQKLRQKLRQIHCTINSCQPYQDKMLKTVKNCETF